MTTVPVEWPPVDEPFQWKVEEALVNMLDELELHSVRKRLGVQESQSPRPHFEELACPQEVDDSQFVWDPEVVYGTWFEKGVLWICHPKTWQVVKRSFDDMPLFPMQLAGWGVKEIYRRCFDENRPLPHFVDDIKLQAHLLDSERRDYAVAGLLDIFGIEGAREGDGTGAVAVAILRERQEERLLQGGLASLYHEVEVPLARILAKMEARGILVDREKLRGLGDELTVSIQTIEAEIYRLAGEPFNINSQRQLGDVLFSRLGLPAVKKTKTGFSTDAETLETLLPLHPIVDKVLTYRQLVKIQSTYVEGLLPLIRENGRIHTTYHQTVTATGRLSSSDPNLQNIPVRLPLGRRVRGVFIPSPGRTLLAADYSQIELRVLAHLSSDANLIQAFLDKEDIHRRTASEIFNIPIADVDATWRSRAKAVNFGIIYGISDYGLSRDTGVSRLDAKDYIERYYQRYPDLKRYFDSVIEGARENGYVTTILGRRRLLPGITSKNHVRRQYAERMAMNTAIQGSAADLIKVAMLGIDLEMEETHLASQMILQVHDELIWDAEPREQLVLAEIAARHMIGAISLHVPLVVEFKVGSSWEAMMPWEMTPHA